VTVLNPSEVRRLADMHAVYRMFDQAGRLLYIGRSGRAGGRFDQHAEKRRFPLVSLITLEWHATYAAAVLAERRAIAAEKPRYNIAGSPVAPLDRRPGKKVKGPGPADGGTLADVIAVFGNAYGLHWQVLAERLAEKFPERWYGMTRKAVQGQCRTFGVPIAKVRMGKKVLSGCRRSDVECAMAQNVLKAAG
jgi:hypothetical protein